ncbi:MAG: 6-pyruvoyl-tetrahydropterin synthase-related protein [Anaerolineae bacterium]
MIAAQKDNPTEPAIRMPWELILVVLMALLAALPLFLNSGLLATRAGGDSPFLLQRTQQMAANLKAGVFPARWMPDGAYGLGYPFYDFYASLPYYVAALLDLAGFGVILGIKLAQTIGMVLGALGMYWLTRELTPRRWIGLMVSAIYTLAPFRLVNIYVRGDSLSEFYAMAFYPLVLLGIYRLRHQRGMGSVAFGAAMFAALILSHNVSALIFTPVAILFLLLATLGLDTRAKRRLLGVGAAGLGMGLMLSVWFWLPALREQSLVQLQEQTTGFFNYAGHFRWTDLVQLRPFFDYTITATQNPFQMGLLQVILAVCGLAALVVGAIHHRRILGWQIGALLIVFVFTFLITPFSSWLWAHIPLLPLVQFPWRLLSIQALAIALLCANVVWVMPEKYIAWLALPVVGLTLVYSLVGLRPSYLPITDAEITPERLMLYESYSGNIGSTVRAEFLPRWTVPRPYGSVYLSGEVAEPLALQGSLIQASLLYKTPNQQDWQVVVNEQSLLAFPTTFYPGWQAVVDGSPQGVEPLLGLGLIGLRLSPGDHTVRLFFTKTTTRRITGWLSLVALLAWLGMLILAGVRGRHGLRLAFAAGCFVIFGVWVFWIPHPALHQPQLTGPLVQDFAWAPLLHHEPQGITWGSARLLDYQIADPVLTPGGQCLVDLTWEKPVAGYRFKVQLVAATAHVLPPAVIWAEAQVNVGDNTLELAVPTDLPPGLYVLRLMVEQAGQSVPAFNSQGQEMVLLASSPLQVLTRRKATGQETALGSFGPPEETPVISLVSALVQRQADALVEITLAWRSERQAPLNYQLSVRLKGGDGKQLASRDLPPFAGGWATTLWRPGELYTDRVLLPVPVDALTAASYILEVVLYDKLTLQAVGVADVPGLSLP